MSINISEIIESITPFNNTYRDSKISVSNKIEMMWCIGNVLLEKKVTKPHNVAWAIQDMTKGIIKRQLIVRSYRIRLIWNSRNKLLENLENIKAISNLVEMLPLIDPALEVRKNFSQKQLKDLYSQACTLEPKKFIQFVDKIKQKYAHGGLGKPLNRERHLKEYNYVVAKLGKLKEYLKNLIDEKNIAKREEFRKSITPVEMMAFSNMCIALTTKNNIRLYKRNWSPESSNNNEDIKFLYQFFYGLLEDKGDEKRARLRRLVSAEVFARISDMLSSLRSEELVADFKERQKMVINL